MPYFAKRIWIVFILQYFNLTGFLLNLKMNEWMNEFLCSKIVCKTFVFVTNSFSFSIQTTPDACRSIFENAGFFPPEKSIWVIFSEKIIFRLKRFYGRFLKMLLYLNNKTFVLRYSPAIVWILICCCLFLFLVHIFYRMSASWHREANKQSLILVSKIFGFVNVQFWK